jgi:uncharacterized LabA/DUF88 family protein
MERVACFVDGFNLYHSLLEFPGVAKYKWLDIWKLCSVFLRSNQQLQRVLYFSAYAVWDPQKVRRHRTYVRALEATGVEVVLGEFKRKTRRCRQCGKNYDTFEEKETDVNIALRVLELAAQDEFDVGIVVSGDSDLVPVVQSVRRVAPAKAIGVLLPMGQRSESLKGAADFHMKIKQKHIESCRLPDPVSLGDGAEIRCPPEWL